MTTSSLALFVSNRGQHRLEHCSCPAPHAHQTTTHRYSICTLFFHDLHHLFRSQIKISVRVSAGTLPRCRHYCIQPLPTLSERVRHPMVQPPGAVAQYGTWLWAPCFSRSRQLRTVGCGLRARPMRVPLASHRRRVRVYVLAIMGGVPQGGVLFLSHHRSRTFGASPTPRRGGPRRLRRSLCLMSLVAFLFLGGGELLAFLLARPRDVRSDM
ncbi:hypothetical protein EDB92DRAFT_402257 [Lactarius akahatsu]|uniref:Uncharacterized protein n=1 Tax=Lactarius akahatsu TaxID=416441 RepID=A0AAD4LIK1_9AGAM|nr:hypothetical protein EDB92DRAFT_402257 [Lactarius akahatsu]